MDTEIQYIISLLRKTFNKGAWHGPTVRESLDGLSESQVFNRLPDTHSIIELVAHMAAWRKYVVKKLKGDVAYKVTEELNFPQPDNWESTLNELYESQNELLAAIETFAPANLEEQVPWTQEPFSYYAIIIHHDLYHIGQINLIKKATVAQPL
jgi:hypothetical protein